MNAEVTHAKLVEVAKRWLAKDCRVVATEFISAHVSESPDAIGWTGFGVCTLVEVEVTRSDFFANAKKAHERFGDGVGDFRWFMTQQGLVEKTEVTEGWGLLEYTPSGHANGYYVCKRVDAPNLRGSRSDRSFTEERRMLISIAGRALQAAALVKPMSLGEEEA